jgi:hypothetical protein
MFELLMHLATLLFKLVEKLVALLNDQAALLLDMLVPHHFA